MNHNSHLTAMARKSHPVPVRWLLSQGLVHGHVLDYGCGRCKELNNMLIAHYPQIKSITNYDPFYAPEEPIQPNRLGDGWYDVILCTYVLCTLPSDADLDVLRKVRRLLRTNGVAYITVRADEPKQGYGISRKGTFQRKVELSYLHEFRKTHTYRIYLLTHGSIIPIITV